MTEVVQGHLLIANCMELCLQTALSQPGGFRVQPVMLSDMAPEPQIHSTTCDAQ